MKSAIQILWRTFLFTFPFSLHFLIYERASYRFGNFNPWVSGMVYLPEILLIIIFLMKFISGFRIQNSIRHKTSQGFKIHFFSIKNSLGYILFILFLLNAGLIAYFWGNLILFGFFVFHALAGLIFYWLLRAEIVPAPVTVKWLLCGALFQIILAFLQTRINHSAGLHFLGEPHISADTPNVAKIDQADGAKEIRAYGTFLHPNILGVYLLAVLLVSLTYLKKAALPLWIILLSAGIFLTGSQAAELGLLAALGLIILMAFLRDIRPKKWLILLFTSLILLGNVWVFVNSGHPGTGLPLSIAQRLEQNVISLKMFLSNVWGVSIGNFTLQMEQFSASKLMPWEFQPVHNVYFLVLNETGLQGLLLVLSSVFLIVYYFWEKDVHYRFQDHLKILPFVTLILLASFDHLLFTSYIGPLLIALAVWQSRSVVES